MIRDLTKWEMFWIYIGACKFPILFLFIGILLIIHFQKKQYEAYEKSSQKSCCEHNSQEPETNIN